jgi:molybdopterin/thiamine biosynthesis adenylyltransferase
MAIKYDRQISINGWNQEKLTSATVAIVGAGALGNHVSQGLIGLGIGTIKILDFDKIEPHNLNRQTLFCESDIGKEKAETLANRLKERNSSLMIVGIEEKVTEDNAKELLSRADIIVDCVDLIAVRRILSRFCLTNDIPLIHGGLSWIGGQTAILTRNTPCINCIYPENDQILEKNETASCTRKSEPGVIYTSQIIAGIMVENIRRVLLPLNTDSPRIGLLIKYDIRLVPPLYIEPIRRKVDCECVGILKKLAPEILKREAKEQKLVAQTELQEFSNFLNVSK